MYDIDRIQAKIWENPTAIMPLAWKSQKGDTMKTAPEYPDGTTGGHKQRTTL